jgi:hypothetical protein
MEIMEWKLEERERNLRTTDEGLLKTTVRLVPNLANWNRGHRYKRSKYCVGKPEIFGDKRETAIEEWRKFNIEEPHNLYSCPNKVIKSKRMRLMGLTSIAQIRNTRNAKKVKKAEYNKWSILWNCTKCIKINKENVGEKFCHILN